MATSGSYDASYNRDQIITEALELIGAIGAGETPTSDDLTTCSRTLNMMVKFWQTQGIAIWRNQEIYVFLVTGQNVYDLGPAGDYATASFVKTEIAISAATGATTIVVDSTAGMTAGDVIGMESDTGPLIWSTIDSVDSSTGLTLDDALTDDLSVDANVFTYTTGIQRPLFITEARLHLDSGMEIPMHHMAGNDYKRLSVKTSTGNPSQYFYEPKTGNGKLYVWQTGSSVKDYLVLTARMPIADFDSAADDPDFPQEWMLPLAYNLAVLIGPKYGEDVSPAFEQKALGMLEAAARDATDEGSLIIEME